ncbi:MAG: VWA domain-containing protein [Candidatus Thiothrix singaporensis]|uniref:VWA domain-containing protein n=1 Tax=Candidatus Thiothrix singaporensis TaxID=2799669 RepID=A0A7L6APX1_9GAMM|nr:MAG: VWA domain-containing protein [Candidatus Thiothrix singaporensis]
MGNNGVTVNDANDADSGANTLLNFPVLQQITLSNGNIIARGCAPAGAVVEFFKADVSPGGAATPVPTALAFPLTMAKARPMWAAWLKAVRLIPMRAVVLFQALTATTILVCRRSSSPSLSLPTLPKATTSQRQQHWRRQAHPSLANNGHHRRPPPVGSGSCAATGGSDILFIVDNSGSITTSEYADFSATIKTVGSQLLADNPANRIATAHFGGHHTHWSAADNMFISSAIFRIPP